MMRSSSVAAAAVIGVLALTGLAVRPAMAQAPAPLVPGYGHVAPVEDAGERPDPAIDYKVVMSVTKVADPARPPEGLDKAARLANLLAQSGVPAGHRHIVVVLFGPATGAVLNEAGIKARGKSANPSAELIARLTQAGVSVRVCGQALAGAKIQRAEVLPAVQVDLSALTTLSTLQLKGYAVISD